MSFGVILKVWGEFACFTRPEMKAERVSYDVITPSAARGILEAIYWKPEIRWVVDRLHVLKPTRFTNLRRHEVGKKASAANAQKVMRSGRGSLGLFVEEERQQRAATVLYDVTYVIEAHFDVLRGADPPAKHRDIFDRRARGGQCFHHPYLGCREFPADFTLLEGALPRSELDGERDLGHMLHDIDFAAGMAPRFFHAVMRNGVIDVPPFVSGAGVQA